MINAYKNINVFPSYTTENELDRSKALHTCQIFQIDNCWAKSVASGTFINLLIDGFRRCLLTAAHVVQSSNLAIESSLSREEHPEYNSLNAYSKLVSEEHDWALFSLVDFHADDILKLGKQFCNCVGKLSTPYTFCGFPSSKNKSTPSLVKCRPYSHTDDEISEDDYKLLKIDPYERIAIRFHKQRVVNAKTQEPFVFPEPQGMSGGPIFDKNGNLAGIVTNYEQKHNVLYGTRIETIIRDLVEEKCVLK